MNMKATGYLGVLSTIKGCLPNAYAKATMNSRMYRLLFRIWNKITLCFTELTELLSQKLTNSPSSQKRLLYIA